MTAEPARIRDLFLSPRVHLLPGGGGGSGGDEDRERVGMTAVGELEGIESGDGVVLPWAELMSFAMDFWDQADIEAALGEELAEALPELLQLADLEVRIPRLEVVALERIAVRDGKSVDAVLARAGFYAQL